MDEREFNTLADATLARIEAALEASGADIDFELAAGGVLEIEFADGSKIIVNRRRALPPRFRGTARHGAIRAMASS